MYVTLAIVIVVAHFIGDFVLQSNNMATKKSKEFDYLFAHVAVYSLTMLVIVGPFLVFFFNIDAKQLSLFVYVTFLLHLVTDYFTSKVNSLLWEEKNYGKFFNSLGFDQCLHYVGLILTTYVTLGMPK